MAFTPGQIHSGQAIYNSTGIFSNRHDTLKGLQKILSEKFRGSSIEIVGCAGLFVCRV